MKKEDLSEVNKEFENMGESPVKDVDLCPERTDYYTHLEADRGDDWQKVLKILKAEYMANYHKVVVEKFPHLLFEKTNDKVYWDYNEESGVYEALSFPEVRSNIIGLLLEEGFAANSNENFVKGVIGKYRCNAKNNGAIHEDFDSNGEWFHAKNGWLEIKTRKFEPHTHERLSLRVSAVVYDPEATCPLYDKFLDTDLQLKKDQIRVVDQFSGLIITTDKTYSRLLTIIGQPGCGKSTLLDIWMHVLGEMATEMELAEFNESNSFYKEMLVGKTLSWFDETDVKRSELSTKIGTLITGKNIDFERKGIQGRVVAPNTVKCVLTANDMPPRAQKGAFRRILKIDITRGSFEEEGDLDQRFFEKAQKESSGILNRMLKGLDDLYKMHGFTLIEGALEDMEDYMQASDPVSEFMHTHFEPDVDGEPIQLNQLTSAYKNWREHDSYARSLTPRSFNRLVKGMLTKKLKGIGYKKGEFGIQLLGLKMKDPFQWYGLQGEKIIEKSSLNF